jgi:hypothetical protein
VNSVKRTHAVFIIAISLLLFSLSIVSPNNGVFAQTTGYSITQVDHQVSVMYSGQVVVQDTIHVSGQITNDFMIGIPFTYSADLLKAVAYDANNIYQVTLGVPLGSESGFYGAEVDFNGSSPSVFTVAFVLSSSLVTQVDLNDYTINFPAYPCLTQNVGTCNVTLTFPSTPASITVTKSDGVVNSENYVTQNLPSYTYSLASAAVEIYNGTMQLSDINQLNRQITISPNGKVTASDSYNIIDNSTATMPTFILDLPKAASNIVVKDETGTVLATSTSATNGGTLLANTTLTTPIESGGLTTIIASYNLPSATIQGSKYTLNNFELFPDFNYYVDHATFTFNPPEGASITTPQLSSLDSSSSLTRNTFQDTLTITRDGISFVDYSLPEGNTLQLSYNYNPVWVSFLPTLWVSLAAVIGCVGAVFYNKRKPNEKEPIKTRREKVSTSKSTPKTTTATLPEQAKSGESMTSQRITPETLREFTEGYDDKKRLNTEIRSLDSRAQKGKIPRRQYKVQRRAIEIRLETLTRNANRLKDVFRNSSSAYADLMKQLDSAEEDLTEAENNIKNLESQQSKGEISIENYKKNIADNQKRKDKAESTINGILLRLREKAH